MAGLLVEILSHGWLASYLIPTHVGPWMTWLPFHVPWGPEFMGAACNGGLFAGV